MAAASRLAIEWGRGGRGLAGLRNWEREECVLCEMGCLVADADVVKW